MKIYLTDSRSLTDAARTCFVAVTTRAGDGHRYIPELYARGVREFVVTEMPAGDFGEAWFTVTDDAVSYLQRMAAHRRAELSDTLFIGITGSVGKTTAKEWLYRSLADRRGVFRSPRSFNSQIGVPLSVLSVRDSDRVAIVEAGVSRTGEMERLRTVVAPQIGLLTPITDEHAAGFADRDEKIAQKLSLFADSRHIVYPACDEVRRALDVMGYSGGRHEYDPADMSSAVDMVASLAGLALTDAPRGEVSTRLEIIDGFNDCRLLRDRFTPDAVTLETTLDFMQRQLTPSRTNTLIMTSLPYADADRVSVADTLHGRSIDRIILVGCGELADSLEDVCARVETFGSVDEFVDSRSADDFDHELILTYGDPDAVDRIISMLERQQNESRLEVDLKAVTHNYNYFRSRLSPDTGIICMLKADGYGAGSYQLARTMQSQGAAYIAVAVVDEGVQLRKEGITMPLIVLNPRAENAKTMFEYALEPEIYSMEMLRDFGRRAHRAGYTDFAVHLKFDTGMHRLGFAVEDIPQIVSALQADSSLRVASVFSHLATADCPDLGEYTDMQLERFGQIVSALRDELPDSPFKAHILNSTGILHHPAHQHQLVRLGIGLYGQSTIDGDPLQAPLHPISTLTTPIINIRRYRAGDTIGYGCRGHLLRDSIVATVSIGYADGLNRHLGCGVGEMVVNGVRCPIVGNVCMDICMLDVTDLGEGGCRIGDRAEVFGPGMPVSEVASRLGTISYEVLTSVSPRIKRVYFRE